jgi:protein SCO1/2
MRSIVTLLFVSLSLAVAACEKARPLTIAEPKRYEVRGIVRAIGFADRELTVEHEEISGYMPAMTMPFVVKEMSEVETLKTGDAIGFQLAVTDKDSWITGVRKIAANEVRLPTAKPAAATTRKGERLHEGDALPEFALVDDQARPITRTTFAGKPLVLTFIFTRCPLPNFCPLMSNHLATIRKAVGEDVKLKDVLRLLSISFDPDYDTPEQLARYAARFTDDHELWRFATGPKEQVEKLTAAFSVQVKAESGTINHGLATALIGPDGVIRKIWRGNGWQPAEVVEELRKL